MSVPKLFVKLSTIQEHHCQTQNLNSLIPTHLAHLMPLIDWRHLPDCLIHLTLSLSPNIKPPKSSILPPVHLFLWLGISYSRRPLWIQSNLKSSTTWGLTRGGGGMQTRGGWETQEGRYSKACIVNGWCGAWGEGSSEQFSSFSFPVLSCDTS